MAAARYEHHPANGPFFLENRLRIWNHFTVATEALPCQVSHHLSGDKARDRYMIRGNIRRAAPT